MRKTNDKKNKKIILLGIGAVIVVISIILFIQYMILINSVDYKLEKIGYSKESIVSIHEKLQERDIDYFLDKEYNPHLEPILKETYFIYENLYTYLTFRNEYDSYKAKFEDIKNSPDSETYKNVVSMVNVGSHKAWYTDVVPSDISKGDLLISNKFYQLIEGYEPENLEPVRNWYSFGSQQISAHVFDAFLSMYTDASKENLKIIINSSYRSYEQQNNVYTANKRTQGEAKADQFVARPGHSEHQTGLAIDLTSSNTNLDNFEDSNEFEWLQDNAHKYGFILRYPKGKTFLTGYSYESWHYRYVGVDVATKVYKEQITYDEYYAFYLR